MGRGWAVGASAALALSVAQGLLHIREMGQGTRGIDEPIRILETLAIVLLYAAWAYAIAVGAYGSKGALVALVGYSLFALLAQGVLSFLPGYDAHPRLVIILAFLNMIAGLAAIQGLVGEIRERRGGIQWGTALFFLAPLVLMVLVSMAAQSLTT